MNSKALVPQRQVSLEVLQTAQAIAPLAAMYRLTEQQATMAMLVGWELGIGLTTSLQFVDVIPTKKGLRPSLRAQAMRALIDRSGALDELKVTDHADADGPSGCTVYMKRTIGQMTTEYTGTFTREDAERADLLGKDNWIHYPQDMYYNRALSKCARRMCSDVILGLYTPEEVATEDTWIVDVTPTVEAESAEPQTSTITDYHRGVSPLSVAASSAQAKVPAPTPEPAEAPEPVEPEPPAMTVTDLINFGFDAEAILVANEGKIPDTSTECEMVKAKLEAEAEAESTKEDSNEEA